MITSKGNRQVKELRKLLAGKVLADRFLVEGTRLFEEALSARVEFLHILTSPRLDATPRGLVVRDRLRKLPFPRDEATDQVLDSLSEVETHQGIIGVARRRSWDWDQLLSADHPPPLILLVCGVQDPGNLGTLIRAADAVAATAVLTSKGTVHLHNPKAVRSTMGSIFRVPVFEHMEDEALTALKARYRFVGTAPRVAIPYLEADYRSRTVVAVGGEPQGIPEALSPWMDQFVTIPMDSAVDSLNVALAATLVLYEAYRQRGFRSSRLS
ncbi:MAG: RNA methyltransferase [Acidobacteria bacterium]|nr:RNA methyltransferase [Acidobacteriota bacterium]